MKKEKESEEITENELAIKIRELPKSRYNALVKALKYFHTKRNHSRQIFKLWHREMVNRGKANKKVHTD